MANDHLVRLVVYYEMDVNRRQPNTRRQIFTFDELVHGTENNAHWADHHRCDMDIKLQLMETTV